LIDYVGIVICESINPFRRCPNPHWW